MNDTPHTDHIEMSGKQGQHYFLWYNNRATACYKNNCASDAENLPNDTHASLLEHE
jgi:hypothetical protein